MANLTNAKNFDFGLAYDNTKLTYASVEKGDACSAAPTVDSTSNTSKLGVAGLTTDTGISGTQVVAYIVFNVKAAAAVGDTTLTLSGVYVGLPETAVTTVTNGTISITANLDPNLPAVEAAVSAYETGALTTLTEVATAEGKKAAAVSAVATLTIADKAPFNTRIANRDTQIAAARAALEKAAAEAAATATVVAYETGALTTLTEVATAEGKKAAADTAVAGLAAGAVKTDLLARIAARTTAIATAKAAIETAIAEAAATATVVAYETGALTTLTEVTTAEGKKAAADTAVAGLAAGTVKDGLLTRIATRTTQIATAKSNIQLAAVIVTINTGAFTIADLTSATITETNSAKINSYIVAIKAVRKAKTTDLTIAEIQQAVTDANAVTPAQLGNIDNSNTGVLSSDASMLKQYYVGTLNLTASEAVRANFNDDTTVDSLDLTAILIMAAKNTANGQ